MVDINIQSIGPTSPAAKAAPVAKEPEKVVGGSFGQWLDKSIQTVNEMNKTADTAALKLATGENKDIHGAMISMQKAEIAMNLMMQVRNKVVSAYEEVKRMQF